MSDAPAVDGRPIARRLGYHPALDGVRGVSVALVLGFHLQVSWLSGGYLGVSVFFTLSGFLVTTLLLEERATAGCVDLRRFYERRARRLMPASLTALAGVCVLALTGVLDQRDSLRRDVLASAWQSLNWVDLFGRRSYADLFARPSPVAHFWSLGIEEQFYLVWPPVVAVILLVAARRRGRGRSGTWSLGALWAVAAAAAPLTAWLWSPAAAYSATWARASELVSGALAAALVVGRPVPAWCRWLAPPALVAVVVASVLTPSGRGWAFQGGLPVFALASTALVVGLLVPGRVTRLLGVRPLVWLGRLSYGVYVYHWPVIVVLDEERTGRDGWSLGAIRVAVTLAVAAASYYGLERPVRERRVLVTRRRLVPTLLTGLVGVNVLALAVAGGTSNAAPTVISAPPTTPTVATTGPPMSPAGSSAPASSGPGPSVPGSSVPASSAPGSSAPTTPTTTPGPTVLALFGDSVPAWLLRDAADSFTRTDVVIVNGAVEGCEGVAGRPPSRDGHGDALHTPSDCETWATWYPKVLDSFGPPVDVAVLVVGVTPMLDHRIEGEWRGPCETTEWYQADVRRRITYLADRHVPVVFVLPAIPTANSQFMLAADYEARAQCVRADLLALMSGLGVATVDLQDVMCPEGDCAALRERDGIHVDPEHAPGVLDWLVDRVLSLSVNS